MRQTLDFLLHQWLNVSKLTSRARYADHTLETFGQVLDTCERIAAEKFAPFNRLVDTQEPQFNGEKVTLPQATHDAMKAYVASGMLAAAQDYELGGMQLPFTVEAAANSFFAKAAVSMGYGMLTSGNANLLLAYGTPMQQKVFAANEFSGRWFGTMCLSEPQAGSSLSDVATRAQADGDDFESDPLGPRYRLRGNKMWISAGEHEMTENIIHLVLAKIPGPDGKLIAGTRGISLFIVPKFLVTVNGALETAEETQPHPNPPLEREGAIGALRAKVRNDVVLAGLNHKLGWRGTTNCLLNFGEGKFTPHGKPGAVGYLVGNPGEGLKCMFHMMNEARIGIGMAATMLGMAGFEASLAYARQRPQGRAVGPAGKDPAQPQTPIIEHADIKRMLLAQKAYAEGGLALCLYCARLVDEQKTGAPEASATAALLLEILTPIAKSWPSQWCLEGNSMAIQVHGGYGYTRDFPVEQYWRDQRLNMIHEGTHGIQAMDLLGRKVVVDNGAALKVLRRQILKTIEVAMQAEHADTQRWARMLAERAARLGNVTEKLWQAGDPAKTLANATPYMEAFGHIVLAWIWLEMSLAASQNYSEAQSDFLHGKWQTCRYFFVHELPKVDAQLTMLESLDPTTLDMQDAWF